MAESYIQVPSDGVGKKVRTRERTIGANTVQEQYVVSGALPTYYGYFTPTTSAANKNIVSIWNGHATEVIKIRKAFLIQSTTAAVTGVQVQFDVHRRTSAHTSGTAVTFNPVDTGDPAFPAGITSAVGATVGGVGALMFSYFTNNDENLLGTTTNQTLLQMNSILPEGPEIKEFTLRPSQGMSINHVTSSTVGTSWGCLIVATIGE